MMKEAQRGWKASVMVLILMLVFSFIPTLQVSAKSQKMVLNKTKLTMVVRDTYVLKMKGTSKKVYWSSNKKDVVTVSKKGKITAKKVGKAVVTAKVNGKKFRCKITVKKAAQISRKKASLSIKSKLTLKLKNTVSKPKWKSKNNKIAKVDKNGVVTPVKKGSTDIIATLRGKRYTCRVTVVDETADSDNTSDDDDSVTSGDRTTDSDNPENGKLTINGEEPKDFSVDLYAMSQYYQTVLEIPDNYYQTFQINVRGNSGKPKYKLVSGSSVVVDENGCIKPKEEVMYWNGNIGYSNPTGAAGERKEVSYQYGTSVVGIYIDGQIYKVTVTLKDYATVYADEKLNVFIKEKITSGLSQKEKLQQITEYVAHTYNYSASYSGYISMAVFGGGDCWASTSMILELCERTGIEARQHYVNGNSWGGHRNVVALADGDVYEVDAGYTGNAPRYYSMEKLEKGYGYSIEEGKAYITEYEGFDTTEIIVPDTLGGYPVAGIERNTFYGCIVYGGLNITKIHLPATVEKISPQAFYGGATGITGVTIDSDNPYYCSVDGAVYSKDKTKLCYIPSVKPGIFEVDQNVIEIEAYAASYCTNLTKVILGDKVETIGEAAFWNCSQLKEINLPESLTTLGIGVFASSSLSEVEVPVSIASLPDGAFQSCNELKLTVRNPEINFGEQSVTSGAVIYGYEGSSAQEYAAENSITFVKIE